MAHFAELDANGVVLRVVVVHNDDEDRWPVPPFTGVWVKTSYNGNIRKNFAGIGFIYDPGRDAFVPPKPFLSWTLDKETCRWAAPTPIPNDANEVRYCWDEPALSWVPRT